MAQERVNKKPFSPIKDEKGSRGATLVISFSPLYGSICERPKEIAHSRYGRTSDWVLLLSTQHCLFADTLRPDNGGAFRCGLLGYVAFRRTTPWPIPHRRVYRLHSARRLSEHRVDVYYSRSTLLQISI